MKQILHLTCSPRGQAAESYRLSRKIVNRLLEREPAATLVERWIGAGVPAVDESYAISQGSSEDVSQDGSMILSEVLIREFESADIVVIGTPMHNLTVPAALKGWLDHVIRARRTFIVSPTGKMGMLLDRPIFVAIALGGRFSGERARQPDFLTPYLSAILGMVGLQNLTFFAVEGTGSGPDAVIESRINADIALAHHFGSVRT